MNELKYLGDCLRQLLQNKGIKAEKLVSTMNTSGTVVTNKPAISRIMTGKRLPTPEEALTISTVLNVPLFYTAYSHLLSYNRTKDETTLLAYHETIDQIEHDVQSTDPNQTSMINYALLYQMIKSLYQNCLVYDVSTQIKEGFLAKLYELTGFSEMVNRLRAMYQCFNNPNISKQDRAWLGAALLYFITPIDVIPDYIMPYGYVDDAVVVGFIFSKLKSTLTPVIEQLNTLNTILPVTEPKNLETLKQ